MQYRDPMSATARKLEEKNHFRSRQAARSNKESQFGQGVEEEEKQEAGITEQQADDIAEEYELKRHLATEAAYEAACGKTFRQLLPSPEVFDHCFIPDKEMIEDIVTDAVSVHRRLIDVKWISTLPNILLDFEQFDRLHECVGPWRFVEPWKVVEDVFLVKLSDEEMTRLEKFIAKKVRAGKTKNTLLLEVERKIDPDQEKWYRGMIPTHEIVFDFYGLEDFAAMKTVIEAYLVQRRGAGKPFTRMLTRKEKLIQKRSKMLHSIVV